MNCKTAQSDLRFQRSKLKMLNGAVILDDRGIQLLGNALLLGYAFASLERRCNERSREEIKKDRAECSERTELRDTLASAGALNDELEGARGESALSRFSEFSATISRIVNGDSPIAKVSLRDFQIPSTLSCAAELKRIIEVADGYHMRRPLCLLGPTPITRSIRKLVVAYFENSDARPAKTNVFADLHEENSANTYADAGDLAEAEGFESRRKSGTGPNTREDILNKRRAEDILRSLAVKNPGMRLFKEDAISAFKTLGLSKRAAESVWNKAAPQEWKKGGRPRRTQARKSPKDLISLFEKTYPPQSC